MKMGLKVNSKKKFKNKKKVSECINKTELSLNHGVQ